MEKYEKAVLDIVELKNDVIRTSGGGNCTFIDTTGLCDGDSLCVDGPGCSVWVEA